MIRHLLLTFALIAIACTDRTPPPEEGEQAVDVDSLEEASAVVPELPAMPDYPEARPGQLAVRAVGALELDRAWAARAGRCARPAMVVVIAEEPGSGASILLQLPPSGPLTGTYPVQLADSTGMPVPPASQVGIQIFAQNSADAYQAAAGEVEVQELTEVRLSGRFATTVRHLSHNRPAQVAGVFRQVDVEALPPDWCERAAAAQDSLAVTPDSAGAAP